MVVHGTSGVLAERAIAQALVEDPFVKKSLATKLVNKLREHVSLSQEDTMRLTEAVETTSDMTVVCKIEKGKANLELRLTRLNSSSFTEVVREKDLCYDLACQICHQVGVAVDGVEFLLDETELPHLAITLTEAQKLIDEHRRKADKLEMALPKPASWRAMAGTRDIGQGEVEEDAKTKLGRLCAEMERRIGHLASFAGGSYELTEAVSQACETLYELAETARFTQKLKDDLRAKLLAARGHVITGPCDKVLSNIDDALKLLDGKEESK